MVSLSLSLPFVRTTASRFECRVPNTKDIQLQTKSVEQESEKKRGRGREREGEREKMELKRIGYVPQGSSRCCFFLR